MKSSILLLALALMSCERSKSPQSGTDNLVTDNGLRGLYDVNSINGSFEVPVGSNYYLLTTLEFEDGKFVQRGHASSGSVEALANRRSTAQFVWGAKDGVERTALVTPDGVNRTDNVFWKHLVTTNNFKDGSGPEYEGFKILAMGQSEETRAGYDNKFFGTDLERALKERMFVGVLVVRFYTTKEQMDDFR